MPRPDRVSQKYDSCALNLTSPKCIDQTSETGEEPAVSGLASPGSGLLITRGRFQAETIHPNMNRNGPFPPLE